MRNLPSQRRSDQLRRREMLATTIASLLTGKHLIAQDSAQSIETLYVPDQVDRSVRNGVDFLVTMQRADGSIADRGNEVAMTSLAIMAMAAIGTQPTPRTDHGRAMQDAIDFVSARNSLSQKTPIVLSGHGDFLLQRFLPDSQPIISLSRELGPAAARCAPAYALAKLADHVLS